MKKFTKPGYFLFALILAMCVGTSVYALNNNPTANDRKQLGLFNAHNEFLGVVLGVEYPHTRELSRTVYSTYISSLNAIFTFSPSGYGTTTTFDILPKVGDILYTGLNCTGTPHVDISQLNNYPEGLGSGIQPQMLLTLNNSSRYFVILNDDQVRTFNSDLNEINGCVNFDVNSPVTNRSAALNEVTLPFSPAWPYTVKPI